MEVLNINIMGFMEILFRTEKVKRNTDSSIGRHCRCLSGSQLPRSVSEKIIINPCNFQALLKVRCQMFLMGWCYSGLVKNGLRFVMG